VSVLARFRNGPSAEPEQGLPLDEDDWRALVELVAAERARVGDEDPDSSLAALERRVQSHVPEGPRVETYPEKWKRLAAEEHVSFGRAPSGGMEIINSIAAERARVGDELRQRDRERGIEWPEYR
jgi:hypothetical protein